MRRAHAVAGLALLAALWPGGRAHADAAAPPGPPPPAQLGATVVIEPPRIEIGDPFEIEIAVVTPPGHRVAPAPVPKAGEGLWVLDAELPRVDRGPGRWVHHQSFRARARAVGSFRWPALEVDVEAPDGTHHRVPVPERPFTVVSLLAEHPEQRSFFSYREPGREAGPPRGPWLPALLGAAFALSAVGLVAAVRRARARRASASVDLALAVPAPTATALAALRRAAALAADPVHAADLASAALRDWAAERARVPGLRAATAEELLAWPAPRPLAARHEAFVGLVRELDALRFPPPPAGDGAARARAAIGRAIAFVAGAGTAA